jgi:spermidine/putrescine transport system ATP-binding protein
MGLTLDAVSKTYGTVEVLKPVTLAVTDGEFLTVLGPSGSGKTTILRMAAGFIQPTTGRILFRGADITLTPTNRRPFNTVFQDYALFPHMTVEQNVGYGLMVRGRPKAEIRKAAQETLDVVGLGALLDRYPSQLSGGQKQRVALARAIVCEPQLILLDEPLSALDAELRRQMQLFLKDLQRRLAVTFVFVTHDQEEAITMSDRIVVMNKGRIEQVGTPKEIYYAPGTAFVARFFGDNNILTATVRAGRAETALGAFALAKSSTGPGSTGAGSTGAGSTGAGSTGEGSAADGPALVAVRPERIALQPVPGATLVPATVHDAIFVGSSMHVRLRPDAAPSEMLLVKLPSDRAALAIAPGSAVTVAIRPEDVAVVPADGEGAP